MKITPKLIGIQGRFVKGAPDPQWHTSFATENKLAKTYFLTLIDISKNNVTKKPIEEQKSNEGIIEIKTDNYIIQM